MDREEFVNKLNRHIERTSAMRDERRFQVAPGPSIIDLINNERLLASGGYRRGLENALIEIETANTQGRKPFYALSKAIAAEKDSEIRSGLETAFFIFKTPYKWIAGERL